MPDDGAQPACVRSVQPDHEAVEFEILLSERFQRRLRRATLRPYRRALLVDGAAFCSADSPDAGRLVPVGRDGGPARIISRENLGHLEERIRTAVAEGVALSDTMAG